MNKTLLGYAPQMTSDVSENERELAKNLKKTFKGIIRELDDALPIIYDLKDSLLEDRPSKDDLENRFRGRLLRYRSKILKAFNDLFKNLQAALEDMGRLLDPEMVKLRGILIAEFDELSDGVESIISSLKNPGAKDFTHNLERVCTQLQRRRESLDDVIDDQLFSHIEHDILGKLKVSHLVPRIQKRTRKIRKLAKYNGI